MVGGLALKKKKKGDIFGPHSWSAFAIPPLHGTVPATDRTKNNTLRYFGTNSMLYCKKDKQSLPNGEIAKEKERQNSGEENMKKDVLKIIKGMKFESNTVNGQTIKS